VDTPSKEQQLLAALREQIDLIDSQIGDLISRRAQCAQEVAEVKKQFSDGEEPVYYRPEREAQVLRKAMERNQGPLRDEEFARLFREIMSACLALEKPTRVAYLGPEGTFTQHAAFKHFGQSAVTVAMPEIGDVFREVEAGETQFGVVPVENSTGGVVAHTLDNFVNSGLTICGEVVLRIHHHLMVSDVTKEDHVTRIYSHAQSFAQCRKWLETHYPNVEKVAVSSNAEAAKRVKSEWNSAAISGEMAAKIYGLSIISEKIEDFPDNSTRFLIIGQQATGPSGDDKTSIMVSMKNQPGALHDLLSPFYKYKIDLTRVETRPSQSGTWSYRFFIDFAGHVSDDRVKDALVQVGKKASDLKILGSFPRGVL